MAADSYNNSFKKETDAKCESERETSGKCEVINNDIIGKYEVDDKTDGKCEIIKHIITIKQPAYGILSASPKQAAPGEIVSIIYNNNNLPSEYKFKGINVITPNSIRKLDSQRSFPMPDSDVTLEAEFEKLTHSFQELNYCPNCGTHYHKTYSKYCHHCGEKRK